MSYPILRWHRHDPVLKARKTFSACRSKPAEATPKLILDKNVIKAQQTIQAIES